MLRSAVGMTHVLRSRLVMDYATSYFPLIVLGYSEIDQIHLTPYKDSGCSACKCVVDQKTSDGSKILAMVLQSHFKYGGQNTQQQRFARKWYPLFDVWWQYPPSWKYFCNSIASFFNTALVNKSTTDLHTLQPELLLGVIMLGEELVQCSYLTFYMLYKQISDTKLSSIKACSDYCSRAK